MQKFLATFRLRRGMREARLYSSARNLLFSAYFIHIDLELWPFNPKIRSVHRCPKMHQCCVLENPSNLLLEEHAGDDVAVATRFRQADRCWARRFAIASPRFIGRRFWARFALDDLSPSPVVRWAHYAGMESSVMILPGVGTVKMSEGLTATADSVW